MTKKISIAIDASNISSGGGVTHLTQMLSAFNADDSVVERVLVWAPQNTLSGYPVRSWLILLSPTWINGNSLVRFFVQLFIFPILARRHGCDVIFSPGGIVSLYKILPVVTMSQNMLPFEFSELNRFGLYSRMWFKLRFLKLIQSKSFHLADGVIFLTEYARKSIVSLLSLNNIAVTVVPHGVESRFFAGDRARRCVSEISDSTPLRLLYVSISMPYKHQIEVAKAVKIVRDSGLAVQMTFVGPEWGWYHSRLMSELKQLDPTSQFLKWAGPVPFDDLHSVYAEADLFIFASSCENMPNILIEAMGSGLPIASSCMGPMPEVLGDGGLYFDPLDPESIASAIKAIAKNPPAMAVMAREAVRRAEQFTWKACSENTFEFIHKCAVGEGCVSKSLL